MKLLDIEKKGLRGFFSKHFLEPLSGEGLSSCQWSKKTNYENVSTPKLGVLNVEFALKLRIYRSLKSFICLVLKKFSRTLQSILSSTTLHSRPVNLFKAFKLMVPLLIGYAALTKEAHMKIRVQSL